MACSFFRKPFFLLQTLKTVIDIWRIRICLVRIVSATNSKNGIIQLSNNRDFNAFATTTTKKTKAKTKKIIPVLRCACVVSCSVEFSSGFRPSLAPAVINHTCDNSIFRISCDLSLLLLFCVRRAVVRRVSRASIFKIICI